MPAQRKGLKRLQDIKTHGSSVDRTFYPHKAFMKISCLEMEKAHRIKEKESAQKRIDAIDARLREIELEKGVLLNRIENNHYTKVVPKLNDTINKNSNDRNINSLVLRY